MKFSSHVGCPPSGANNFKTWWSPWYLIFVFFLAELGPICNSMETLLCLKSCEDHSLLKSYNGGLWKNDYRSGPINKYQVTVICTTRAERILIDNRD